MRAFPLAIAVKFVVLLDSRRHTVAVLQEEVDISTCDRIIHHTGADLLAL